MTKITGTVKWFSNKKGFGFISPTSANSPTTEEIFVHQTSIFSDGAYRTLTDGAEVEFEVDTEADSGKFKAINVTAPGGGSIKPPPRDRRRRGRNSSDNADADDDGNANGDKGGSKDGESADEGTEEKPDGDKKEGKRGNQRRNNNRRGGGAKADQNAEKKGGPSPFHDILKDDVKAKLAEKGIELGKKTTIDIAMGDTRLKLGQGGYAALAIANGTIGEGTYTCDEQGVVNYEWLHCIVWQNDEWKPSGTESLLATVTLTQDGIGPVKADETPDTLWGSNKADPRKALESSGFQMRRVVLTRPPGSYRGGRRGGGGGGGGGKRNNSSNNQE